MLLIMYANSSLLKRGSGVTVRFSALRLLAMIANFL